MIFSILLIDNRSVKNLPGRMLIAKIPEKVSSFNNEGELGEGGMAIVKKGSHAVLRERGTSYSISILLNEEFRKHFLQEAGLMLRNSRNSITVANIDGRLVVFI